MAEKTRFGSLLKHYRQAAGLSQEALAELANLSPRAISDLERGVNHAPRASTLELLANALSLSKQQRNIFRAAAFEDGPAGHHLASTETFATRSVIPLPPTRLIGRETERTQAVQAFLDGKTRLLSLIGPSGVGKTRLALAVAQDLTPYYAAGVVFVPLATIRDVSLVPHAIAQHLGIHEMPSQPIAEQIEAFLQDQSLLLVLDNLEQVLDCSPLIARLLETCPRLAILATSRSPLRLRAEMELLLAPLPLTEAAALFFERARAVQPDRDYPNDGVADICEQLDCLPLAIELAATQVKLFSISDLQKQITHWFTLLRNGARDLPARQKTMEDAIAWSYDLLTEPQQRCFRALGCFTGGWTLEAAEWVCFESPGEAVGPAAVPSGSAKKPEGHEQALDRFAALVESSLVQTEQTAVGAIRFSMLELIREYAFIQLKAAGELEAYQRRHATYYANLAEKAQAMFVTGQADPNLSLSLDEYNIQAAMHWVETQHEAALGLRLAYYTRLWHMNGQSTQAEVWLERMLALDRWNRMHGMPAAPISQRIELLSGFARTLLGHGKFDRAGAVNAEALQLAAEAGNPPVSGQVWMTQGLIAQAQGRLIEAEQAFKQGQRLSESTGDAQLSIHLYVALAEVARMRNDLVEAAEILKQALEWAESAQAGWDAAITTTLLGLLANQQQDYFLASRHLREGLQRLRLFGSPIYIAWCLEGCAATLLAESRYRPAVRLCAASFQLRQKAGSPLPPAEREAFEHLTGQLHTVLGQRTFSQEWELGTNLSQDEVIDLALSSLDRNPSI